MVLVGVRAGDLDIDILEGMAIASEFAQGPAAFAGDGKDQGPQVQAITGSEGATEVVAFGGGDIELLDFGDFGPTLLQFEEGSGDFSQDLTIAAHELLEVFRGVSGEDFAVV